MSAPARPFWRARALRGGSSPPALPVPGQADSVHRDAEERSIQLQDDSFPSRDDRRSSRLAREERHLTEIAACSMTATSCLPGSSTTATLPEHNTYIEWPGSPCRTIASPSPKVCATVADARSARCASDSVENRSTFERTRSRLPCSAADPETANRASIRLEPDMESRSPAGRTRSGSPHELDPSRPDRVRSRRPRTARIVHRRCVEADEQNIRGASAARAAPAPWRPPSRCLTATATSCS